jgi:hypothetical protein
LIQGLCDLDVLALARQQGAHSGVQRQSQPQSSQRLLRPIVHAPAIYQAEPCRGSTRANIFFDGEFVDKAEFLKDRSYSGGFGLDGSSKFSRSSIDGKQTGIRRQDTGKDVHERALACTILAD